MLRSHIKIIDCVKENEQSQRDPSAELIAEAGRLAGWLAEWLAGQLVEWLAVRLAGCLREQQEVQPAWQLVEW